MKKKAFYDGNILASSIECKDANGKKSKKDGYSGKFTTEDFKAVQNPIVSYLLPRVPWLSMFIMAVLLILKHINFFNDEVVIAWLPIIISGYFVAGLCLFAQGLFMKKIPEIFIRVWCRKIIVCAYQFGVISGNNDSKNSKVIVPTNIHLEEKYLQFINEIQTRLNNSWQWFFGLIFLLLTFLWNPLKTLNNFPLLWNDSIALLNHLNQIEAWRSFVQDNWHLLNELPVSLIAFILGLMVWRMYVASSSVGKLVDKFQVEPKLGHLDLAGGLSPLGDLCLWNCIIASIPSIYISGWLFIGDLNKFQSPYADMPNYYIYEFLVLLFSLSVLPIMFCFILPLWKVHREMNNWRISKLVL